MGRYRFNYYETVKYLVEFEARDLDEAKALIREAMDPSDLEDAVVSELKADLDIDYDFVEEVSSEEV